MATWGWPGLNDVSPVWDLFKPTLAKHSTPHDYCTAWHSSIMLYSFFWTTSGYLPQKPCLHKFLMIFLWTSPFLLVIACYTLKNIHWFPRILCQIPRLKRPAFLIVPVSCCTQPGDRSQDLRPQQRPPRDGMRHDHWGWVRVGYHQTWPRRNMSSIRISPLGLEWSPTFFQFRTMTTESPQSQLQLRLIKPCTEERQSVFQ